MCVTQEGGRLQRANLPRLVRQLLRVLKDNSQVIVGNTRAIESVAAIASDTKGLMQQLRDELLKRPCLIDEHGHGASR